MWQFRWVSWVVLYVLALLIQTAWLPQIFPPGYVPSMVLPVTVLFALYETPPRGLVIGAVGGLMQDVWAGRLIGLNAVTMALVGYAVSSIQSKIVRDRVFVPGLLAGLAQVAVVPFQWVVLNLFGFHFGWAAYSRPLADWLFFQMLFTPGLGGILGFRARHEVDSKYSTTG